MERIVLSLKDSLKRKNNMNTCFVITGLIDSFFTPLLIESYKNSTNKIVSTWNNQDPILIKSLKENGFHIIQDEYPTINKQTNYQSKAIYNGCVEAKKLGYTHVIRMRTDIISDDIDKFYILLNEQFLNKDKFVSFCGIETFDGIYFYDVMIGGQVNKMLDFFKNEQVLEDTRYIEKYLLEMYLHKTDPTREDIKSIFNFCYQHCEMLDIHFYFYKYEMEIIYYYCTLPFVWI